MPIRLICSTDGPLCLRSATTSFWHNRCRRGPSTPTPIAEVRLGSRSRFGLQLRKFMLRSLTSSLTHHKASIGQAYMLTQKRLESAFLCIIQTFVEWLGGIREFFKLDRDCFQLDTIRLELFSPFS